MSRPPVTPISRMRKRVTLQRRHYPPAPDGYGQRVEAWDDVATVWAEVLPLAGKEMMSAGGVASDITHRVTIRQYEGLAPDWRVSYAGRVLNIDSVADVDEQGRTHVLMCKEVV